MSRRKKKHRNQSFSPSYNPASPVTSDFDAVEDRIRGEEIITKEEARKAKESQQIKKALDDQEVDRRLEELRKQLGLRRKQD